MIKNDRELEATLERIKRFQQTVRNLRHTEPDASNFRAAAEGYLAEIDRMNLEIREYLVLHPSELMEVPS